MDFAGYCLHQVRKKAINNIYNIESRLGSLKHLLSFLIPMKWIEK